MIRKTLLLPQAEWSTDVACLTVEHGKEVEPMASAVNDPEVHGRLRDAACRLYDAECALHSAHQAHEDRWIAAANGKLHDAVEQYLAVAAADRP